MNLLTVVLKLLMFSSSAYLAISILPFSSPPAAKNPITISKWSKASLKCRIEFSLEASSFLASSGNKI